MNGLFNTANGFVGTRLRRCSTLAMLACMFVGFSSELWGQVVQAPFQEGRAVPREVYYIGFQPYYAGDYPDALKAFQSAARSGVRNIEGNWIDAVCYHTMLGECYYRLGQLALSLEQHDAAVQMFIAHRGWLKRIKFDPQFQPAPLSTPIPWGPSTRQVVPGRYPDTMLSMQGSNIDQVVRQGGVLAQPELYPINAKEVVRCLAISIRRRGQLLGPLAAHTPLTTEITKELTRRDVPPNHWFQLMLDVALGIAKSAEGQGQEALTILQRSLLVGGQLDHPLTALALLEIGDLARQQNQPELAARSYFEATFSAVAFGEGDVLQEAFTRAAQLHRMTGGSEVFAPLEPAAVWAQAQRWDRVAVALRLASAQNLILLRQDDLAEAQLNLARRLIGRSAMNIGEIGGMYQFNLARIYYQRQRFAEADAALAAAVKFRSTSAPRMFQIELADRMYVSGELSPRIASQLFAELLREPRSEDWIVEPMDTLAYEMTPHADPLNRWLSIGLERDEIDTVIVASDALRRHRFFQELPVAGRKLALRWVLEGPTAALDQPTQLQRQSILNRYPQLADLSKRASEARRQLASLPVQPTTAEQTKSVEAALNELSDASSRQETILADIALRPEPANRVFPPLYNLAEIQQRLKPGQTVIGFVVTDRQSHAILITSGDRYKVWALPPAAKQQRLVSDLLRNTGNYNASQVLNAELLTDSKWKGPAEQLFASLAPQLTDEVLAQTKELIVVPDKFYWYLPFELLQVPTAQGLQPLIELTPIRYAPTLGVACDDRRPVTNVGSVVIVAGRVFSRDADDLVLNAANEIKDAHPGSSLVRAALPASSSLMGPAWNKLVVLDDVEDADNASMQWSPSQYDRKKPGGNVADWLELPFGAPDVLVLAGFPTAAENGLRGRQTGDELMVSTCGLMASGTRTILLSRWRTGGRMSFDLAREFLQGLSTDPPSKAWQRSALLARASELDPLAEPRLKGVTEGQLPQADHPFFWSSYLLIDSGVRAGAGAD